MNGRDASRAERFEDEKRRIIDSCFSKRDEDGSLQETYITHIKITEFQTSPTSPPPPSARTPQYEKPRVIIVAVRKSGRVRVHKSKENPNGTFSIGKTWFLDDLTAIESFTSSTATPNHQQWAGDVGFVVTLGKPYYWEAQTDKEKKFFIASLVKIYSKYTGGRTPSLTGFEQRELEQVLGGAQIPRRQDRPSPRPAPLDTAPNSTNNSISSGYNAPNSAQSTPAAMFPERVASRSPLVANGKSSPAQSIDTGRPSQEQQSLRRLASSNKSQDSVAASSIARSEDATSLRPNTRNGVNGTSPYATPEPTPQPVSEEKPPERKRPPMDPLRALQADRDLVPAPLMSPAPVDNTPPEPPPEPEEEVKPGLGPMIKPGSAQPPAKEVKEKKAEEPSTVEESRRSIVAGNDIKYLATLGIDPSILDNRTGEFAKWLDYFGWVPGEKMRSRNFDELRTDLDREVSKAQAGGWLARFQEEDERVEAIKRGIDLSISECDELDNLLTLYSVELSTLSDDIAYIEAQGQGLQVQAANQKLLRKELESLLETCAISESDLDALRAAPLETASGVEEIEASLVTLFKAMIKIDPTLGNSESRKSEDMNGDQSLGLDSDYGKMRIVQEKKEMYLSESSQFMRRLVVFMERQFSEAFRETKAALDGALSKKADARNHEAGRDLLWMYAPLILYARDVDLDNWNRILQIYQDRSHPIYKVEFRDAMEAWKKNARKVTGDESELLFTSQQEKKEEGLATTARKLTVKRSQTLARSLRSPLGDGSRSNLADKTPDGRALPYEVFAGVLDDLLPLVEMEQNFIVDFFHATTLEQSDFPDLVAASRPQDRRGGDLKRHRLMEPDRDLARRVTKAMESIFVFLESGLQQLMEWVLGMDPLQGVGILATLERKMADMSQSNQDFLNNVLQKLHGNLEAKFKKFVDDQIRAIEETKVKIKKRKGVIHFIRIFPNFATAVENMLASPTSSPTDPPLPVRRMVDREYDRILKSMFDSLKVIARENPALATTSTTTTSSSSLLPTSTATSAVADPEDKEALNFHILLIENMNHFLEEVDNTRGLEVLDDWREAAQREMAEHMGLYLNAVMRRPLGKLLEHLENVEAQLQGGKSPAAIAAQPSNSKTVFNKVLGGYDGREVRKGIEALRKRVEKHFGDEEAAGSAAGVPLGVPGAGGRQVAADSSLVNRVLRECERFYGDVGMRIGRVTTDVYGGDVLFEWPRAEVRAAFAIVGGR
ncbi:hypothetical protein NEMBOFW57_008341 [Staphylotrichum longicolle]|uniref:Exocyst complex component Sec3 PIP2-binding N-terminal domain-containing protein n=1 Tax=Staphylotrichum longicolle TaxID=669026 RepID=A0AAD4EUY5_9PEZI|nr:hypothetical protein NEMBOFW57_008341 [Staphylotrichum longicolle]